MCWPWDHKWKLEKEHTALKYEYETDKMPIRSQLNLILKCEKCGDYKHRALKLTG